MKNLVKSLVLAGLFLAASTAQAVIIQEQWVNYDPELGIGDAEFTVINDSANGIFATASIYAFIVANDAVTGSSTSNNGWDAAQIDAGYWDNTASSISFSGITDPVYTASIGTFNSLFSGFSQATMYTFSYYNQRGLDAYPDAQPIAAGQTVGGFFYTTRMLASPFIAIDQSGNIVGSGDAVHVSAVPVPAAAWLFGSGLLGLAGIARRKV